MTEGPSSAMVMSPSFELFLLGPGVKVGARPAQTLPRAPELSLPGRWLLRSNVHLIQSREVGRSFPLACASPAEQGPYLGQGAQPYLRPPIPASETLAHPLAQPGTLTTFFLSASRNPGSREGYGTRRRGRRAPTGREAGVGGSALGRTGVQ